MSTVDQILANPGVVGATWKLRSQESEPVDLTETLLVGQWRESEDVFLPDNRAPVDVTDYSDGGKYRSVVKLIMRYEGQGKDDKRWAIGTGWLVSPNTFVTAGHCVFDINASTRKGLGRIKEMKVYIGYRGKDSVNSPGVQRRDAVQVSTTVQWVTKGDRKGDVAFVRVDRPFTGNLRTFSYTETPTTDTGVLLGVVGYPGDKFIGSEKGAEMYELFETVDYDLQKNGFNMLSYRISTYKGQSGAPVIQRDGSFQPDGRRVIGTHCYGGGDKNSASVSGGKYGVKYPIFIRSLDAPDMNIKDITGKPLSTLSPTESDTTIESGLEGSTEGFFDVLKDIGRVVAPIAQTVLPMVSPLLGPLGAPVSAIGGIALGALSKAVQESGFTESDLEPAKPITKPISLAPGTAERAILAESALQTVLRLERSPASQKLLNNMEKKYVATGFTRAHADKLGPKLVPLLSQAGLRLATTENLARKETVWQGKHTVPVKPGSSESDFGTGDANADSFLKAAGESKVEKAKGGVEAESFFGDMGSFLAKGLSVAKPVLLTSARAGLQKLDEILAKKQVGSGTEALLEADSTPGVVTDEKAASLLAHRAVVAECALQAVLEADKKQLTESVILGNADGVEPESFFSGLLKTVQTIGPAVLKVAAPVLKTAVPVLLNTLTGPAPAPALTNGFHVNGNESDE